MSRSPSQLTRFQDGGYAVGASCSLLLADPLSLVGFLKSWAGKHAELQALVANPVIQYTRYIRSAGAGAAKRVKSVPLAAAAAERTSTTALFRAAAGTPDHRALAAACVAKAVETLGARAPPPRFTVVARDGSEGLSVLTCAADGDQQKPCPAPRAAHWRDEPGLALEDLALEGRKPVHVSYCVVPCADEGLVVVMPAGGTELLISATVANCM